MKEHQNVHIIKFYNVSDFAFNEMPMFIESVAGWQTQLPGGHMRAALTRHALLALLTITSARSPRL